MSTMFGLVKSDLTRVVASLNLHKIAHFFGSVEVRVQSTEKIAQPCDVFGLALQVTKSAYKKYAHHTSGGYVKKKRYDERKKTAFFVDELSYAEILSPVPKVWTIPYRFRDATTRVKTESQQATSSLLPKASP